MKYITLGKTDIKVNRLCVGCMTYGKPTEDFHLWILEHPRWTSGSKRSETDKSLSLESVMPKK